MKPSPSVTNQQETAGTALYTIKKRGKRDNSSPQTMEPEIPQIPADASSTDAGSTKKRSKPKAKASDRSPSEGMDSVATQVHPSNPADLASA